MTKRTVFTRLGLALGALLASPALLAHGYVDYPKARQQICKEDGGFWWPADGSNIPNLACRAAFQDSGSYMLVQHHEFAANVPDYNNMNAVRQTVPDGQLCAAGDAQKSGMNLASPYWQSTTIDLSETPVLPLRFRATTPHNPSFWQIYLTRPGFDPASRPLRWGDLDLIHEIGNIPAEAGYYAFDVPLPTNRSGPAILYTRWQRNDVVGEGFYNCSDVHFVGSGGPVDPPVSWFDQGPFVNPQAPVHAGDEALLRVFDENGQELLERSWVITPSQLAAHQWAFAIAEDINADHNHLIRVGLLQGDQVQLQSELAINRFYLANSNHSVTLSVRPGDNGPVPADCEGHSPESAGEYPDWPRNDWAGHPSHAVNGDLLRYQGALYQAKWWTQTTPGSDDSWRWICDYR